jgi:radical SAM superfamily enzyme YgiQ (UPF0313 family)
MRIALVDLNWGKAEGEANIGLLEMASYLKRKTNVAFEFFGNPSSIVNNWRQFDLLAFSSMGFPLESFLSSKLFKKVKRIPRLKVAGGTGPSIIPGAALNFADVVIVGEGEIPFQKLVKLINTLGLRKKETLSVLKSSGILEIENLVFRSSNGISSTQRRIYSPDEIKISKIDWSLVKDVDLYIKNWRYLDYIKGIRGLSLVTTRSCPFNCAFCQPTVKRMYGGKLKKKKVDFIIDELLFLKRNFKLNAFMFHDDTFTYDRKRVVEICDRLIDLKAKGINFKWICNTRADSIDDQLASKMRAAGCEEVRLGIETFDEEKRNKVLWKGLKDVDIREAIRVVKRNKMKALGFFMIGLPSQTSKELFKEAFKLTRSELDLASISVFTPLPGTWMGDYYGVSSHNSYYYAHGKNCSKVGRIGLEFFRIFTIFLFYFNPKRIGSTLRQLINRRTFFYKLKRVFLCFSLMVFLS